MTDEHLVIKGFFGKKTLIPWSKIEGFDTWNSKYAKQIVVITSDIEKDIASMPTALKRGMARLNFKFSGAIYFIQEDLSGMSQEELLEKCRKELKNHQIRTEIKHD